jgi:high-affinity nickel-transport protein
VIGTIELVAIVSKHLHARGALWVWVEGIDINTLGFIIAFLFVATWVLALSIWRFGHIEERWSADLAGDPLRAASTSS